MSGWTEEEAEKAEIEFENLLWLLEKYGISLDAKSKWLCLALALARDKVKGFSNDLLIYRKNGRPSSHNALAAMLPKKAKTRGAPEKPKLNPEWVDKIKLENNLTGRGSDKKALEIWVEKFIEPARRISTVKYLQKRLSEQRQLARANSKK